MMNILNKNEKIIKEFYSDLVMSYSFYNEKGDAQITVYTVFDGIELTYNSIHTDHCYLGTQKEGNFIEIHYCREGGMEQQNKEDFFYLLPGDLSVIKRKQHSIEYSFPIHYYHGISIIIDIDKVYEHMLYILDDININLNEVVERLCGDENYFVIRSQKHVKDIFSELYEIPENYKNEILKIKVLELLLILSRIDIRENRAKSVSLSRSQADMAQKIAEYLRII